MGEQGGLADPAVVDHGRDPTGFTDLLEQSRGHAWNGANQKDAVRRLAGMAVGRIVAPHDDGYIVDAQMIEQRLYGRAATGGSTRITVPASRASTAPA